MKIIGHRGVRGIEVENTPSALFKSAELNVDAIELDVRLTKDKQPVVCHNESLKDVYKVDKNIRDLTLAELKAVKSPDGHNISTLKEVMELGISKPMILDIKSLGLAKPIHKALGNQATKNHWSANSLFPEELEELRALYPDLGVSLQIYKKPFAKIKKAKDMEASAITLVLYLLNPLTYWLARRAGLEVRVYQNYLSFLLTSPIFVRLLGFFYPSITVCTDRPDKILPVVKK